MGLAVIKSKAEDELICDFQEVYGLDFSKQENPLFAATLALGLRYDSRTMMKLSGMQYTLEQELMAAQADSLAWLVWSKTKNGAKGRKRPKPILAKARSKDDIEAFATAEDLEARMRIIRHGDRSGNSNSIRGSGADHKGN